MVDMKAALHAPSADATILASMPIALERKASLPVPTSTIKQAVWLIGLSGIPTIRTAIYSIAEVIGTCPVNFLPANYADIERSASSTFACTNLAAPTLRARPIADGNYLTAGFTGEGSPTGDAFAGKGTETAGGMAGFDIEYLTASLARLHGASSSLWTRCPAGIMASLRAIVSISSQMARSYRESNSTGFARCLHTLIIPPMRYLINLITTGSGSTLVAAKMLGVRCVGVEQDAHYAAIAEQRIAATQAALL